MDENPLHTKKGRPNSPKQSAILGVFWMALAIIAGFIAYAIWGLLVAKLNVPPGVLILPSVGIFALVGVLFQRGSRHFVADAEKIQSLDSRAPIVYLRAFSTDSAFSKQEQFLAQVFQTIGPFITIGRPGEKLPLLGAYRKYTSDGTWREEVKDIISNAKLAVIRTGQTDGLKWEIEWAIQNCEPKQLVFLVPPAGEYYEEFQAYANALLNSPLPGNKWKIDRRGIAAVVHFNVDWQPVLTPLKSPRFQSLDEMANYRHAFRPLFSNIGVGWKFRVPWISLGLRWCLIILLFLPLTVAVTGFFVGIVLLGLFWWTFSSSELGIATIIVTSVVFIGLIIRVIWRDYRYWKKRKKQLDTSKNLDDGTNMRSSVRTGQIRIVNKPESSGLAPRRLESVQGFLEVSNWTLLSTYANHLFYDSLGVWLKRIYLE